MINDYDDFDMEIQPEELQCDNPIDESYFQTDEYWDENESARHEDFPFDEHDEGSDMDNWEDEQVFHDNEW